MSIRHIVLWKLAADDADTRALHAEQIEERLLGLRDVIDEIEHLEIGRNVVSPQTNWDVALVSQFADADALERYQVHPAHQEVAAFVRSVVAERACVDYPA
ncbi:MULTISPECIES: Dabb family protein [Microbacterium]|uniref:Stress responsive alpha-beta barrel domain-containing protein n=1 Tax=Microbacterium testaceum TaxID=2033 RepID=A0A147F8K5_MICTE|nr:Dabb family protein [Microbacterium testaceum]KTS01500.1 stress responsive alpha-beta barrel domain-containing protein [Microbacterium testaceum]KTS12929.1 stress responsive alpha-beta barrel domain-containing protein [Microbacterium testaceum]KTS64272.1 stress responsive alpha-beta barrel domain-containing protein [Microbacterium testaceum]